MTESLSSRLRIVWAAQAEDGFLLGDPFGPVETRTVFDPATGVEFRFRWLPHRAVRGDPAALVSLGILDPECERGGRFADPRHPGRTPCYLCPAVMRRCFPVEVLIPLEAGGRRWWAGANFAWLSRDHYTVVSDLHVDQDYDEGVLDAMVSIRGQTDGEFRVVFNGAHAGATIPWHLHLQITSERFPIESLPREAEDRYPLPVRRFERPDEAHRHIVEWLGRDPERHRVNVIVGGAGDAPSLFVALRDTRRPDAVDKGLMGGYEAAGAFAYGDRLHRAAFEHADLAAVRRAFADITPEGAR